jgi:cystathionine beta-lyase
VTPAYPPFFSVIAETGQRVAAVALLDDETEPRLPLDAIAAAFDEGSRILLMCNPHNRTGYVATREELLAIAGIAAAHDGVVLSDEIHAPLTLPGATHLPLASLGDEAAERTITLTSASKAWNLAGLKCGLAVARPGPMGEVLARLPVDLPDRVGHLGVLAGEAAFAAGERWLDRLVAYATGRAAASPASSPSGCRASGTSPEARPTWRGSTAGSSGSATTPRGTSSATAGSRSPPVPTSERRGAASCD